jgi:hypothetical protein
MLAGAHPLDEHDRSSKVAELKTADNGDFSAHMAMVT